MSETDRYILEFLFDASELDEQELRATVNRAIDRQRGASPEVTVERVPSLGTTDCLKLSIQGSREEMNRCHFRLRDEVTHQCRCVLLRDEAGAEIRQRAYPVLAQLEQSLRAFINRGMTEIIGFDWWETIAPRETRERVAEVQERAKVSKDRDHPLELTYLYDLVGLVTGSVTHWSQDRSLSPADLGELLNGCSTIDELRRRLNEKTRDVSLWDEVFARYYTGEELRQRWNELRKTVIRTVVPVRDKVMHHRPVFLWELEELHGIAEVTQELIDSAREQLPEEERVEAEQATRLWGQAIGQTAFPSETIGQILAQMVLPSETIGQILAQMVLPVETTNQMLAQMAIFKGSQPAESHSPYKGSSQGTRFHRASCPYVDRITPANRVSFATRDDALSQGYSPCTSCKP